ncbi:PhnD/SsuA/transferrin family substrate-binding protein [Sulfuritalea sp.]|uniref:substrate-binding domain-containing protein n=1 Tax=Sulfuritalea sp. TaxID=2480090 RepID=UPI00286DD37A|nr:PhnD/SsuA/transferrin family substrate-binding protein [Sulfuritalea sp.]
MTLIKLTRILGVLAALLAFAAAAADDRAQPIRVGLTPTFPHDQYRPLESWRLYMERKLQRPVEFVRRDRYIETMDMLRLKKLDFAWICDYPYVQFRKQVRLMAVPVYKGRPYYRSYLIVPATDKSTTSIAQLRNKVFAYTDPYSNTGFLSPRAQLQEAGEDPARFFRNTFFAWSHRRVIESVATGLADGGAVSSHVWDTLSIGKPELMAGVRVASEGSEYGFAPFVARHGVGDQVYRDMQKVLLEMKTDEEGKALLRVLNLDGFIAGDPRVYESTARLIRAVGEK